VKSVNKQTVKIIDRSSMLIYNDERQVKIELWRDGGQPTGQCDHAAAAAAGRQALFTLAEVVWFV
jgi:hypothetical protein